MSYKALHKKRDRMTDDPILRIYINRWFARFATGARIGDTALVEAVGTRLTTLALEERGRQSTSK